MTNSMSETECINQGGGCLEDEFRYISLSRKNPIVCEACNGDFVPYFNWVPSAWSSATFINLTWVSPAFQSKYQFQPTLNLSLLHEVVQGFAPLRE